MLSTDRLATTLHACLPVGYVVVNDMPTSVDAPAPEWSSEGMVVGDGWGRHMGVERVSGARVTTAMLGEGEWGENATSGLCGVCGS